VAPKPEIFWAPEISPKIFGLKYFTFFVPETLLKKKFSRLEKKTKKNFFSLSLGLGEFFFGFWF